jgi:uncharacterized protein YdaU (DUF1376 family)
MAEFPALTLWTDSYLADTRTLTTLEHGAYLLLLMEAWRRPHCDLPDDDAILAKLAGLSTAEWAKIKTTILAYWKLDGRRKTFTQKRLLKERDAARKRSKSQKDKAAKRWNNTEKGDAPAIPRQSHGNASTATATAIEEDTEVSSPDAPAKHASGDGWPTIPDWVPVEPWNGFIEMRRRKRANPTPRAVELLLKELEKLKRSGCDPGEVLDQSTKSNWTDVYKLKDSQNGTGGGKSPSDKRDGFTRALHRDADIDLGGYCDPASAADRHAIGDGGGGGGIVIAGTFRDR